MTKNHWQEKFSPFEILMFMKTIEESNDSEKGLENENFNETEEITITGA